MDERTLDHLVDRTERLGVVGSPSSTSALSLDVLNTAVNRKLVGELALFRFSQDGIPRYALGQITEVKVRNIWHEDPTMRSLIRQRGRVEAVSERQDTHLAQMVVSAVFSGEESGGFSPSMLGTVPATGTPIHLITDDVLDLLLARYRDQIFYLGRVYGSKPKLPLWFKHFDRGPDGAGEAYHLGIFGKTGSGKSVLAKMILLAYARYPGMALLVIDPQGEFARDMTLTLPPGEFPLPLGKLLRESLRRDTRVLTVRGLVLDRWSLFEQILFESPFFERLTIPKGENRALACSVLAEKLQKAKRTLAGLHGRDAFERAWTLLREKSVQQVFYRSAESRRRFATALEDADPTEFYAAYWKPVAELFRADREGAMTVEGALGWLLQAGTEPDGHRPVLVIDLSREQADGLFWSDTVQSLAIARLLDGLTLTAEHAYKQQRSLNTLVVIDEAHRLAPRERQSDHDAAEQVRRMLVDAARTTRKYGLGWLFVSQTLSSLHPEILQQIRIFFFGFGLGLGQEFQSLQQLVGSSGPALDLYQLFRDPHSAFDVASREYSFMTIGPVSPLSFAGTPLFFNAFNSVEEFLVANRLTASTPETPVPARRVTRHPAPHPAPPTATEVPWHSGRPEPTRQPIPVVERQPMPSAAREVAGEGTGPSGRDVLERLVREWPTIRSSVKARHPQAAALLAAVKPARIAGNTLHLVTPHAFHRDRLNDDAVRRVVETVIKERTGMAFQLRCVAPDELPPAAASDRDVGRWTPLVPDRHGIA
jgi:hypothetical protein